VAAKDFEPPGEPLDSPIETVDRLYRRYAGELRAFFRRQSRRHPAEDLVHHVFVRLLNCQGLSRVRDPKLYLYKIAWHVLYTENRRLKYDAPLPADAALEESEGSPVACSRLWDDAAVDDLIDLGRALEAFRPEQQIVFLMYWQEHYTCEEISAKTRINRHTVRKYVGQVMLELRKYYNTNAPCNRQGSSTGSPHEHSPDE
jgi:RNA polymerase sigma factor (sigma-70 family)